MIETHPWLRATRRQRSWLGERAALQRVRIDAASWQAVLEWIDARQGHERRGRRVLPGAAHDADERQAAEP